MPAEFDFQPRRRHGPPLAPVPWGKQAARRGAAGCPPGAAAGGLGHRHRARQTEAGGRTGRLHRRKKAPGGPAWRGSWSGIARVRASRVIGLGAFLCWS